MLYQKRDSFNGLEKKLGKIFSYFPVTPNQWTLISVIAGLVSMYFIIKQSFIIAIFFFLFSGFADYLNGIIARHRNIYTKAFMYLDTVSDRYVDMFILFGMLFLSLPKIFFPSYIWIFLILFGSLATAFAKAAAKEKGLENYDSRGGFVTRPERIILLSIALYLGTIDRSFIWTTYILIFMVFITNFTALQRVYLAIKNNK